MDSSKLTSDIEEKQEPSYSYYSSRGTQTKAIGNRSSGEHPLNQSRLKPSFTDPSYLIYRERTRIFSRWLDDVPGQSLTVLDVGGRIQPYRALLKERLALYVAIDPQLEGMVDVLAVGESVPFPDNSFDLVICTQVLGYVSDPFKVAAEVHRVLKPGGHLLLSAPSLFPRHHDERWRFLPEGLRTLLNDFATVEILPEGHSIAGICRTLNVCIPLFIKSRYLMRLLSLTVIPVMNTAGVLFDRFSFGSDRLTANYSVLAQK